MIDTLIDKIKRTAPVVVGLDPLMKFMPPHIEQAAMREYGATPAGYSEALWQFNKAIIDHIYDLVPAVKPQIAMYERYGLEGLAVYCQTTAYAREKGLLVIGDVKRGDIGSTAEAYALGHLGADSAFGEDFVTVNPYLGYDGVQPFIAVAKAENKGIFVLVKTSNPGSGEFQDQLVDGRPLYELVADKVAAWGGEHMGGQYSEVGAVVGATYPAQGRALRQLMPKAFILVPGYGAQGGRAADLKPFFNADGLGAIINSSRGIIAAWQEEEYAKYGSEGFAAAARQATLRMIEDIKENVTLP
ncbi:MAG: orotidine-5'-phosphate decarboxylase [Lachnospiraceae bacterium]|jgi:orotidine-5'-phosphate decarboxylase|nr:orotidine-5'-phosphate decarboxylase [Lachnospiraceae bacterium]